MSVHVCISVCGCVCVLEMDAPVSTALVLGLHGYQDPQLRTTCIFIAAVYQLSYSPTSCLSFGETIQMDDKVEICYPKISQATVN